ncbi:dolichol kinase [Sphaerochaeta pleomorpha str. Grapes]|uniref:Dolichol kinase n=1 Tax=Sphaerochaeta pleomorpha (strain ATCC BAA-1885 / DSM 22778 / Grapes) TaxID=158190 RepID=G8QR19_SPHPG|nr:membrane protein [Sphaerochaeta pleomorpha]AEV29867.1 dolichol kinase [Sphaerochaeta pleomorpha str. Grapes]
MDNNIAGLVVSFIFLGSIIVFAIALGKFAKVSSETVRKIVHVGVSNWWFVEMFYFTQLKFALVGPIVFIITNSLFTFLDWGKAIGFDDRKRNYGLIYFPVTLLLLVLLQYNGFLSSLACLIGVLVMGYGDGFAALIGKKWGKKKLPIPSGGKTYVGTLAMFLISLTISLVLILTLSSLPLATAVGVSLLIGAVASLIEAITPLGIDNLSVPLICAFIAGVFV